MRQDERRGRDDPVRSRRVGERPRRDGQADIALDVLRRCREESPEQVRLIRGIVEGLGREIATPDDVRAMLGLKGKEKVGF